MARQEMSSLVFSQEYEAEFISHGSGMFHAEWIQHYDTRFEGEERVFILGLGLAGQVTAAGLVIAAKGLIRFPELQAQAKADADDPLSTRRGPFKRS